MLILAFASMGVRAGAKAGREAKVEEEHCLLAHAQLAFLCSPDPTACACLVLPIRLGPSLSITNKDSFPQSRPQDNLIVQFFCCGSLYPGGSRLCQVDPKNFPGQPHRQVVPM